MNDFQSEIDYLKKQISKQEKMASLGLLSAGIAHEIQNPLNFVINFSVSSARLLRDLKEIIDESADAFSEEQKNELQEILTDLQNNMRKIEANGNRASSIVKGILLYSRGKENEYIPTNLAQLTKEYVWLSFHAARANNKSFNVSIVEHYEEGLPPACVIPQDFSRVVLNLMSNACYAVYHKSQQTKDLHYKPTICIELKHEGDSIRLVIEDNGTGISEEVQSHLYTPFYTTKPIGEGTGLGLAISKSIVERKHHGQLIMETEVGEFTRFTILIPIKQTSH